MATWSQSYRTLAYELEGVVDAGHEDSDEADYSTKDEYAVKIYPGGAGQRPSAEKSAEKYSSTVQGRMGSMRLRCSLALCRAVVG